MIGAVSGKDVSVPINGDTTQIVEAGLGGGAVGVSGIGAACGAGCGEDGGLGTRALMGRGSGEEVDEVGKGSHMERGKVEKG